MHIKSFDIFDTCLSRICGEPVNVFHLMGASITGEPVGSKACNDFVNARSRAEVKARNALKAQGREEVTIGDIYAHFDGSAYHGAVQALIDLELDTERSVLRPVETALREVVRAREQGSRICFISDMYLPGAFIIELLSRYGFWTEGDRLYLSSEHNATKYSGKLFDIVSEIEGVPFGHISHTGDHLVGDIQVPKAKGIQVSLSVLDYNRYEQAWISKASFYKGSPQISMLAGLSRSVRRQAPENAFEHILGSVVAPLLVPFVAWIIEDARKRNITKIFFQARDGYVLYRIAQVLLEGDNEFSVSYLYGSRRTFYLPGMYGRHQSMVDWVTKGAEGRKPVEMLTRLSLDSVWILPHLERLGLDSQFLERPMADPDVVRFKEILLDPEVEKRVQERAFEARELVKRYFSQEGLGDGSGTALVDIGWSRVSHQSVNNILDTNQVFGYFLGVFRDRITGADSADYAAVFYPEDFPHAQYERVFDAAYVALLEQFFVMTNDPTTIGYQESGNSIIPLSGKASVHQGKFEQYRKMRDETLLLFAREYRKLGAGLSDHIMLCRACGLMAGRLFVREPEMDELRLLLDFRPDQGVDEGVTLVRKITVNSLLKELLGRRKGSTDLATYLWREGSIKYSFGNTGYTIYRWLQKRKRKDKLIY